MNFEKLFKQIKPEEITDNVFTLAGKDFYLITAGTAAHCNSMVASGGGFGFHLKKPTSWCNIRADRYTIELMRDKGTYTLAFFPPEYKKQVFYMASGSGRTCDKMSKTELTKIVTPSGNIAFAEARMIIECRLMHIVSADDMDEFCTQEAKDFIIAAYKEENVYRKMAFGEITGVWVRR